MLGKGKTKRTAARLNRFLIDRCTIDERIDDEDNWRRVADDVRCRVMRMSSNASKTADYGQSEAMINTYVLSTPLGTPLDTGQRVTIGTKVFFVTGVIDQWTNAVDAQALVIRERGQDGV